MAGCMPGKASVHLSVFSGPGSAIVFFFPICPEYYFMVMILFSPVNVITVTEAASGGSFRTLDDCDR